MPLRASLRFSIALRYAVLLCHRFAVLSMLCRCFSLRCHAAALICDAMPLRCLAMPIHCPASLCYSYPLLSEAIQCLRFAFPALPWQINAKPLHHYAFFALPTLREAVPSFAMPPRCS